MVQEPALRYAVQFYILRNEELSIIDRLQQPIDLALLQQYALTEHMVREYRSFNYYYGGGNLW